MKTKEITKFVNNNKKTIVIVAVGVLLIVIIWGVVAFVKKMAGKAKAKKAAETLTGQNLTQGLNHAEIIGIIAEACIGPGTNENAIYSALGRLGNNADWEYVQNLWIENYTNNLSRLERFGASVFGVKTTLVGTLSSELNKKELAKCREILEEKNITPDF